jgi:hypothetical protein
MSYNRFLGQTSFKLAGNKFNGKDGTQRFYFIFKMNMKEDVCV